jgi:TATA-box binding protein (TBP) (component of TFIID and TFIIIB)
MFSPEPQAPVKITNNVGTVWYGQPLYLRNLACVTNGKLGKKTFPACVTVIKNPATTNCCFKSGRGVNTGGKTAEETLLSMYLMQYIMCTDLGEDQRVCNYHTENIATSCCLGYALDLDAFWADHQDDCDMHESFAYILFEGGKVLPVGLRDESEIPLVEEQLPYFKKWEKGSKTIPAWRKCTREEPLLIHSTRLNSIQTNHCVYSFDADGEVTIEQAPMSFTPKALYSKKRTKRSQDDSGVRYDKYRKRY